MIDDVRDGTVQMKRVGVKKFLDFLRRNERGLKPELVYKAFNVKLPVNLGVKFEKECWKHGRSPEETLQWLAKEYLDDTIPVGLNLERVSGLGERCFARQPADILDDGDPALIGARF